MGLWNALIRKSPLVQPRLYYAGFEPIKERYFVRSYRDTQGRSYEIVDRHTRSIVSTYNQRGPAFEAVARMNGPK